MIALMHSFYRLINVFALASGLSLPLLAAELGEPVIRSHIGQPLIADVELNTISDPGTAVTVRMAHGDVYKGANVSMNPVIGSINMSVMKRDGGQFLHITSTRAVVTENVHLFLELTDSGKRHVRAVTLWLTPDPAPAPVVAPAPLARAAPVSAPAPAAAVRAAPATAPDVVAAAPPARVLRLPAAAAPATCPQPQFTAEQTKTCALVDEKNAALSAQIVDLEAKVKLLQAAFSQNGAVPVRKDLAQAVPPPPPKRKPKNVDDGFPWLLVIGAVAALAVASGGAWFLLKRRNAAAAGPAPIPWRQRLAAHFKRKHKPAPAEAPAA